MSKVAVISDLHFGVRNNNKFFHSETKKFLSEIFFPEIKARNISTVINAGDLFDSKTSLQASILNDIHETYLKPIEDMNMNHYIIAGNHDIYSYPISNDVNWLRNVLNRNKHIVIDDGPISSEIDGRMFSFLPWIPNRDRTEFMKWISYDDASVLIAHLELSGFNFSQFQKAEFGDDPNPFKKYDLVLSGHYHHKQNRGNIHYLGNPVETTKADEGDQKGFHILDTDTLELEFIANPRTIHKTLIYDPSMPDGNPSDYEDKILEFLILDNKLINDYNNRMIPFLKTCNYHDLIMTRGEDLVSKNAQISDEPVELKTFQPMSEIFTEYLDGQVLAIPSKRSIYEEKLNELYKRATET